MFLFSLSWRQGWVGFTCTDSCSVTLRLLYVFSCACFHLHTIRMHFIYHSCCSRFMWILYFICMCGKKLIPSSRYIHSIYQCPLLPVSFLPGWMSTLPLCGCSLQWVFYPSSPLHPMMFLQLKLLHSLWWYLDLSPSLKMAFRFQSLFQNSF